MLSVLGQQKKGRSNEKETDHSNFDVRDPDGFIVHAYEWHQRDGRRDCRRRRNRSGRGSGGGYSR